MKERERDRGKKEVEKTIMKVRVTSMINGNDDNEEDQYVLYKNNTLDNVDNSINNENDIGE